jgi:hypothetical protein
LVNSKDVIRPNLSIREGIGGFSFWWLIGKYTVWVCFLCLFNPSIWCFLPHRSQMWTFPFYIILDVEILELLAFFLLWCNIYIDANAEIIVSGGMTMPQLISPIERAARPNERISLNRIG